MRSAFTLLELILVMTILVILAVLSYPSIDSMYGSYRVQAAADQVRAAWAEARTHAANEGRPYRFSIVPNKRNFRVAPAGSNYWSGRGDGATNDSDNPPYILDDVLPKTIRFTMGDAALSNDEDATDSSSPPGEVDSSTWSDGDDSMVIFQPNGTVQTDFSLTLRAPGVRPLCLKLRALTGSVTTTTLGREGERP